MPETEEERWMRHALVEAGLALKKGEVPVGAVVVYENKIIGRGHNQVEGLNDPTAHAEIIAIGAASTSTYLNSWRLSGATLYVTLEPCAMCAGALVLSRIDRLIFGPKDPKAGACGTLYNIVQDIRLNHQLEVVPCILEKECGQVLRAFFEKLRRKSLEGKKGNRSGNTC